MARSVPEWIGKRPETMPTQKVFTRLLEAQKSICACGCGRMMIVGRDRIVRDHKTPLKDGGENRESNIQLIFEECHKPKTAAENSARAEAERKLRKAFPQLRKRTALSGPDIKYSRARGCWVNRRTGEVVEVEQ